MLVIPEHHWLTLIDHAQSAAPSECCGVLGGTTGDRNVIKVIDQLPNAAAQPETRYRIDPVDLVEAIDRINAAGYSLVGFYHSHPAGPSSPSPTDQQEAHWEDHLYVIVDLAAEPTVTAWNWTGTKFDPVPVVVTT